MAMWSANLGAVQMETTSAILRFSIADAVFARELRDFNPAALPSAPRLVQPQLDTTEYQSRKALARSDEQRARVEKGFRHDVQIIPFFGFGECVVRANPNAAKALLLTKVETEEEARAFVQLLPAVERCQPDGKLAPDKADVRGAVALNYVRLATATGQLPTSRGVSQ
jgi:hypothetical protein